MAIINSYPLATPKGEDLLIATQVPDPNDPNVNEYSTKSFTVDTLGSYIVTSTSGITGSGTVNTLAMFTPNGTTIGDSIVTYDNTSIPTITIGPSPSRFEVQGDIIVDNRAVFNGPYARTSNNTLLEVYGAIQDGSNSTGTAGQVLSSTGTGVQWIDNTAPGTVTGSGTTNTLPVWTDGPNGVLGDSIIIQNQGGIDIDGSAEFNYQLATASSTGGAARAFIEIYSTGPSKFRIYRNGPPNPTGDGYARFKIDRTYDYGAQDQMVQEVIYQKRGTTTNVKFKYDGDVATADDVYLEFYELPDGSTEAWVCCDDYAYSMVTIFYFESLDTIYPEPVAGTPTGTLIHSTNPDTETPNWDTYKGTGYFSVGVVFDSPNGNSIYQTKNNTGDTVFNTRLVSAPYTESERMRIYNNGDVDIRKDFNEAGNAGGIVNLNLKGGTTSLYGGGATINAIGGTSDYASLGINVYQNTPTTGSPLGKLEGSLTYNFQNKWAFDADATGNPGTITTTYEWKKAGVTEMSVYDSGLRIPNGELLVGTTVADNNNPFRIKAKGDNGIRLVDPNTSNDPYLQFYRDPNAGGAYINSGTSTSITFGIPTGALPQLVNFYGDINLQGALSDGSTPGSQGTDGQVLTSHTFPQGRRTKWEDPTDIVSGAITKLIPFQITASAGASDTYSADNNIVEFSWTGGNGTYILNIPSATGDNQYRNIRFVTNSTFPSGASDKVQITAQSGETIDGAAFFEISKQYEGVSLWSNGTEWIIIQAKAH